MVPDELATITLGEVLGFVKPEKCSDCCLGDADCADLTVYPDVHEGVGPAGSDRIVFHSASLGTGELPN